ncbi:cyclopropane-fatty-acyl-phospholipid synthase [Ranunculus cassubicifolius]
MSSVPGSKSRAQSFNPYPFRSGSGRVSVWILSQAYLYVRLKWLKGLLLSLGVEHPRAIPLYCDSQSALYLAQNPVFHERTKNIEVDLQKDLSYHFQRRGYTPIHGETYNSCSSDDAMDKALEDASFAVDEDDAVTENIDIEDVPQWKGKQVCTPSLSTFHSRCCRLLVGSPTLQVHAIPLKTLQIRRRVQRSGGNTADSADLERLFSARFQWNQGFSDDGRGIVAAHCVLGQNLILQRDGKHMVSSMKEKGARVLVTKFLKRFITAGHLTLLEEGGTVFSFEGTDPKCRLQSVLRIHNPQFYWKVATEADLGLADAYVNGDFSFDDKEDGLLNLFMIFIANRDSKTSPQKKSNKRAWWTPLFFTTGIASVKYFIKHTSRKNTLTQARRNISRHYDLSNDLFGLFLDETMTYSCAIFKSEDEDLKIAQLRKISHLTEKARINDNHEILEIGCGWGSLAIEVVKQTGCKYTGITLSEQQLKYAERKVKEAGLQDRIRFLLSDYRQLPKSYKYDRIISCEMLEAVGHEFMEDFFACCDSVLAEDGLVVFQFISIPDERYDEYRRSSDFIKEYIFPGGCLPSLSRITTAMTAASGLCVEHIENIGIHYYQTLQYWRKNFMANQSEILALGFDEKFIRTWEYYFIYCAAGFKTRTLGNYQIVFSRPGNHSSFKDPYKSVSSV